MAIQARILPALCCLHNFIRFYDADEIHTFGMASVDITSGDFGELQHGTITRQESTRASGVRDSIAQAMWTAYQQHLSTH
jgi:hypothetical protein